MPFEDRINSKIQVLLWVKLDTKWNERNYWTQKAMSIMDLSVSQYKGIYFM